MTLETVSKVALALFIGYAAILGFIYVAQGSLIYYPQMGREIATTPSAHGLPYEDISIATEDGERLHAWWLPTANAHGAVLLFHGNAGNISHRIDYARMFGALGYSTLLVDYRGYGKSTGSASEEGTYRDALASWSWLTSVRGFGGRDIVVFGESLGGAVATWLAEHHQPRALVIASTFTSVPNLGAELYRLIPVRLLSRFKYDTVARLPNVRAPVLVIHSRGDDIIPFSHGERLFAAAREPKEFLELRGGHNDGFVHMTPEWTKALGAFLERTRNPA
jgi:uncharacterized protein